MPALFLEVKSDLGLVNSQKRLPHIAARSAVAPYGSNAAATRVALWPPKPNELFRATRTFFSRATLGVQSRSHSSPGFSRLIVGGMTESRIASAQAAISIPPAPPNK